jgi:hypothetical protein
MKYHELVFVGLCHDEELSVISPCDYGSIHVFQLVDVEPAKLCLHFQSLGGLYYLYLSRFLLGIQYC